MKIAVITGGASGIGRELCVEALRLGYQVVCLDVNQPVGPELEKCTFRKLDVSNVEDFKKFSEWYLSEIKTPPDFWINNAGIAQVASIDQTSELTFKKTIEINLLGVIYGTKTALSLMNRPPRGVIVNVSSLNGIIPAPYMTAYAASKHGVVGFTRSLQEEFKFTNSPIRAVLVLPGFVATPLIEGHDGFELPKWFRATMDSPQLIAQEIWRGVQARKAELVVGRNGAAIFGFNKIVPGGVKRMSRFLVAKDWREFIGLDPISKGPDKFEK